MPTLFHANGILQSGGFQVDVSEAEALGTGGFSACVWLWRDPQKNTAGNVSPIWQFNDGSGSGYNTMLSMTANSNSMSAGEIARETTGVPLDFLGLDNRASNSGYTPNGRWSALGFIVDGPTVRPRPFQWNSLAGGWFHGGDGYQGSSPTGSWKNSGTHLWVGHSTYWGFPGALAHIQMWNRALTDNEMMRALLYPGSVRDGLTIWFPLDNGSMMNHGLLGRHGRRERVDGFYVIPRRAPATSDGSGFGRIPPLPSWVREPHRYSRQIIEMEAPAQPDGRIVLAGDDFTDVDGTNILSHTPSGPGAAGNWIASPQAISNMDIEDGMLLPKSTNGTLYNAVLDGV